MTHPQSIPSGDILSRIVETKRQEVKALEPTQPQLEVAAAQAPDPRNLREALAGEDATVALIAEVKRRSPGAGAIHVGLDPVRQAVAYEAGGASALSVLTDREYFQGSLDDLRRVRQAVQIPILRKDFVIHPSQVWEARAAGADAVLLIVRILSDEELRSFRLLAEELGMSALVEIHGEDEVPRALASGARILGVNNRDLKSFRTDLQVSLNLAGRIPPDVILVSESGISTREEVESLGHVGVDGILVGEALVRSTNPQEGARRLSGVPRTGDARGSTKVKAGPAP